MQKKKPFFFSLPSRSLTYLKLVQGECNAKEKAIFLFIAEPPPIELGILQDGVGAPNVSFNVSRNVSHGVFTKKAVQVGGVSKNNYFCSHSQELRRQLLMNYYPLP